MGFLRDNHIQTCPKPGLGQGGAELMLVMHLAAAAVAEEHPWRCQDLACSWQEQGHAIPGTTHFTLAEELHARPAGHGWRG